MLVCDIERPVVCTRLSDLSFGISMSATCSFRRVGKSRGIITDVQADVALSFSNRSLTRL